MQTGGLGTAAHAKHGNPTGPTTAARSIDASGRWIITVPGLEASSQKLVGTTLSRQAGRELAGPANTETHLAFKFFIQFTLYTSLYCAVCLVASVLCLSRHISDNVPLDGTVIAVIALGAFFGLFTFGMIATSLHYIFSNLTNVEMIRQKTVVYLLAIRVPQNTPPGPNYGIITYPLPKLGEPSNGTADLTSSRDRLATRTFAIVATEPGENPWDLGVSGNWTSVMGTNILDWLFPVRYSPCVYGETNESLYRMGPLYDTLRSRYNLPKVSQDGTGGVEMGHLHR